MPGLVKIGLTKHSAPKRAGELFTTGVPAPFVVDGSWHIPDAALSRTEADIHRELAAYRYRHNREFFLLESEEATEAIDQFVRKNGLMNKDGNLTQIQAWGVLTVALGIIGLAVFIAS